MSESVSSGSWRNKVPKQTQILQTSLRRKSRTFMFFFYFFNHYLKVSTDLNTGLSERKLYVGAAWAFKFVSVFQQFFSVTFLMLFPRRAMKTSVDSLKLAVSWKESQVQGAKFTVKVCIYTSASWGGG